MRNTRNSLKSTWISNNEQAELQIEKRKEFGNNYDELI